MNVMSHVIGSLAVHRGWDPDSLVVDLYVSRSALNGMFGDCCCCFHDH